MGNVSHLLEICSVLGCAIIINVLFTNRGLEQYEMLRFQMILRDYVIICMKDIFISKTENIIWFFQIVYFVTGLLLWLRKNLQLHADIRS